MESIPNSPLNPAEKTMYKRFLAKNPDADGMTEVDFKELRDLALEKGGGVKKFFALKGIVMEEMPSEDELHEMKDSEIAA